MSMRKDIKQSTKELEYLKNMMSLFAPGAKEINFDDIPTLYIYPPLERDKSAFNNSK